MPHLARDPVIAAAAIVQALPPLVAHETDPTDSAVLAVTRLSTGLHTWDISDNLHNNYGSGFMKMDGRMPGQQPACFTFHERSRLSAVVPKQASQPLLSWSADLLMGALH